MFAVKLDILTRRSTEIDSLLESVPSGQPRGQHQQGYIGLVSLGNTDLDVFVGFSSLQKLFNEFQPKLKISTYKMSQSWKSSQLDLAPEPGSSLSTNRF